MKRHLAAHLILPQGITLKQVVEAYATELGNTTFQLIAESMTLTISGGGERATVPVQVTLYAQVESMDGRLHLRPVMAAGWTENPIDEWFLNNVIFCRRRSEWPASFCRRSAYPDRVRRRRPDPTRRCPVTSARRGCRGPRRQAGPDPAVSRDMAHQPVFRGAERGGKTCGGQRRGPVSDRPDLRHSWIGQHRHRHGPVRCDLPNLGITVGPGSAGAPQLTFKASIVGNVTPASRSDASPSVSTTRCTRRRLRRAPSA